MIALFAIAAAALCVPIAIATLVSIASRREDSAHTIADIAPCQLTAFARRVLSFHAQGIDMPVRPWDVEPVRRPDWYGSTRHDEEEEPEEDVLAGV
jgi:hypothetical protein